MDIWFGNDLVDYCTLEVWIFYLKCFCVFSPGWFRLISVFCTGKIGNRVLTSCQGLVEACLVFLRTVQMLSRLGSYLAYFCCVVLVFCLSPVLLQSWVGEVGSCHGDHRFVFIFFLKPEIPPLVSGSRLNCSWSIVLSQNKNVGLMIGDYCNPFAWIVTIRIGNQTSVLK